MIFGIKTKKDRKIDLLQAELNHIRELYGEKLTDIEALEIDNKKLENELNRRPVVTVYEMLEPNTLVIEKTVDFDIPVEFVKQSIVRKIAEGIEPYVKYDEYVDVNGKRIRGYLTILCKDS